MYYESAYLSSYNPAYCTQRHREILIQNKPYPISQATEYFIRLLFDYENNQMNFIQSKKLTDYLITTS